MKTVLIVSRHPSRLFLEQAKALRGRYRVVVAIGSSEREIYAGVEGIEVVDWSELGASLLATQSRAKADLVAEAERKTGVPFYRAASNYLLYYRLIANFQEKSVTRFYEFGSAVDVRALLYRFGHALQTLPASSDIQDRIVAEAQLAFQAHIELFIQLAG